MPRHFARTNGAHASIQCPRGAFPIRRLPLAAHPRSGVMLVLAQVSAGQSIPRIDCSPRLDINENKSPDVDTPLMRLPPQALAGHVRPVLLTGERGFF